jgi:rare lipoprotein A
MRNASALLTLTLLFGGASLAPAQADTPPTNSPAAKQEAVRLNALPPVTPRGKARVDHSGRKEKGKASYYASHFTGRKMADGRRMNPRDNVAASKTLPLGSTARVTNLETGESATVKVQDRGPFVAGRVVDLSPKVANELDIKKQGVASVEVKPITVPQPDGSVKLGAGAAEASPKELETAIETTRALMRTDQGQRTASAR